MAALGWWIVATTVRPVDATARTTPITTAAARESRPVLGSSRKSTLGLVTSSTPIVSRLRCSPVRPLRPGEPTRLPSSSFSSTSPMTPSTSASRCARLEPAGSRSRAASRSASPTVASGACRSACST